MKLDPTRSETARQNALDLDRAWGIRRGDERWRSLRATPRHAGLPTLHLEDVSRIPFVSGVPGVQEYQHRARVRARTGDVFAGVSVPDPAYERYCSEHLGLGDPLFVRANAVDDPCAVTRGVREGLPFDTIREVAATRGMLLHPYMAIEDTWELAAALRDASGAAIGVLGPTPGALWVANDKARLDAVIRATLGDPWCVETQIARTAAELADALGAMAARHDQVGLKRTRCASAMGNRVFDGMAVRGWSPHQRREAVDAFLRDTEWAGDEEVLVVEWVKTELSPSTQLWIPAEGEPLCEGVYEQLLEGEEKCFLGSRPSTLPEAVDLALADASLMVAAAFQALGYVGRCSFDFVVAGDPAGEFQVKFTECNGRWGGTSTPMSLVDRLLGPPEPSRPLFWRGRRAYVAQDWMDAALVGAPFGAITAALGDTLFDPRTGSGRFILYNVGPLAQRGKFDVIALGDDPDDAWRAMRELLPKRLEGV